MSTVSTQIERDIATEWDSGMDYPSAVFAGIVGDARHAEQGGYHISIMDQPKTNYSVIRPDDKAPPGGWPRNTAAAIDMSMSTADMIKCWNRVLLVWINRAIDPRAKYFNAFNGWNGTGSAERLDFVAGTRTTATPDHKTHCHDELRRRYVNDPEAKRAHLSVFRGETLSQYLGGADMDANGHDIHKDITNAQVMRDIWDMQISNQHADKLMVDGSRFKFPTMRAHVQDIVKAELQGAHAKLDAILGKPTVVLSDANVASIAETLAAALVGHEGNQLTPEDLGNIKEVVDGYFRAKFAANL